MGITSKSTILTKMNKIKAPFLTFLLVLVLRSAFGQPIDYKGDFNIAKNNLDAGNYTAALTGFARLLDADPAHQNAAYTSFFYAVSAYSLGQNEKARDMFLQITKKYANWDKTDEAYLWLIKISFELSSPNMGMFYARQIKDASLQKLAIELRNSYLEQLDVATLRSLLEENEDEIFIAQLLASRLVNLSYNQRDNDYLFAIIHQYNLDSASLGLTVPSDIFKDQYKVAVMLPLFVDRLWQSGVYVQKSLAVDIYEGVKLALAEFDADKIDVHIFDTKKDSAATMEIIQRGDLDKFDAILGPLFPKPLALVADYSNENKKNFVNPVSTNSALVKHNPYAFLLRTGAESMGRIIAEYVQENLDNKVCAIYYGPRATDSLAAYNYSMSMRADSFNLAITQRTQTNKAREIYDSLTSAVPVVDSVELRRMWKEKLRVRELPKKDSFLLKVDSLGHIFIASDNKAIASEVMAAITSRGDTTQLIGVGNWFSTANASLELMESLGVWLAMQEFENMLDPANIKIRERYSALYHKKPSKYVYFGYYAMKFLGESLLQYGVYFQNGYKEKGNINRLFDFAGSQDNRHMVLYKLEEGIPVIINSRQLD
jgi:receptor family ligand binding protein